VRNKARYLTGRGMVVVGDLERGEGRGVDPVESVSTRCVEEVDEELERVTDIGDSGDPAARASYKGVSATIMDHASGLRLLALIVMKSAAVTKTIYSCILS